VLALFKNAGVACEELRFQAPLYNEKDGKLVKTLNGVFQKVTGLTAEPVAIGGGTYARALEKGCGFGPEMEGDENVLHQPNEYITFKQIGLLLEIYYEAVKELTIPKPYYIVGTI
jgi:succinyl-diaminopimelate desuccinylase